MKRFVAATALFAIGILLASFLLTKTIRSSVETSPELGQFSTTTPSPSPTPAATRAVGKPVRLVISSIGVDASMEYVGLDASGNMDVPKADENVAWYELGYKPGEQGSAVLAGHFDAQDGSPAVFWNLAELTDGDMIEVTDEFGSTFIYVVQDNVQYPFDQLPLAEIFASQDSMLRLITCDGVFDASSRNYSKRRVVTARLQP